MVKREQVSEYVPAPGTRLISVPRTTGEIREWACVDLEDVEAFDSWLAEVKAQAWADGYTAGTHDWRTESLTTPNPYRGENK